MDGYLLDNIPGASSKYPLLTNNPLQSATARYLPLVAKNLKRKIKAFDTHLKSGVTQLRTKLTNNINSAIVHLESSVSNNLNAGVANLKTALSNRYHSLAAQTKSYKHKPYAAHLESFLHTKNQIHMHKHEKQQPPNFVSYTISKPKLLHNPVNNQRKKPNKYDALMTDLGISGYKHFENSVIRDLEKREEQKVEATIHTLFENPKYGIDKPTDLQNYLKSSHIENITKPSPSDSSAAYSALQHYSAQEDLAVKSEAPENRRNKKLLTTDFVETTTHTLAPTEKWHGKKVIALTGENKHENNTLMFRWKSLDLSGNKLHSNKEIKNPNKTSRLVQHKKIAEIHAASTASSRFQNDNSSKFGLKDHENIQHQVISLKEVEISKTKPYHWQKQASSNQQHKPQESTKMSNITTQRPHEHIRTTKHTSKIIKSNRKSLDSYRISTPRKPNIEKVSGYRGSIKFSDHMHNEIHNF